MKIIGVPKELKDAISSNKQIIDVLSVRIIHYGDSINWKGIKSNKELAQSAPLNYLWLIKNWTIEEQKLIDSIQIIPFDYYKGYGLFIEKNADYVNPTSKQQSIENLYSQLDEKGLHSFRKLIQ